MYNLVSVSALCPALHRFLQDNLGLKEAGYTYFNLDDCKYSRCGIILNSTMTSCITSAGWMAGNRTAEGKWQADPVRFPSGTTFFAVDACRFLNPLLLC